MRPVLRIWIVFLMILNGVLLIQEFLNAPVAWVNAGASALMAAAALVLLLTQRKGGFYLMCVAAVLSLAGTASEGGELASAAVTEGLMVLLTFLLMKKEWKKFR